MKTSKPYRVFQAANFLLMASIVFLTLYPFLYMLAVSFSSKTAAMNGLVTFYPIGFTPKAYQDIISQPTFWSGYKYTLIYTITGTVFGLFMSVICAYPLSKQRLKGKKPLLYLIVLTMYFGGGMIPNYLLVTRMGLGNTLWAIILPGCISAYNVIIMKTFFEGIPTSLLEAAEIDGLDQIRILGRIVLPLSKPIIATMCLFISVGHWNSWFSALIYMKSTKYPITLFLRNIVMGASLAIQSGQPLSSSDISLSLPETLQSATVMLVTIPILCVYPFVQKHFVHGIMIGSIKG